MNLLIFSLFTASLASYGAEDLTSLREEANHSIVREMKALRNSKQCIDTAMSVEAFKNCNYQPQNFNVQEQEEKSEKIKEDKGIGSP